MCRCDRHIVVAFVLSCLARPVFGERPAQTEVKLPHQVTTHPADDLQPSLSPDGQWVAFASRRNGNLDIWVRPVRGGKTYQITTHQADDYSPAWTPKGDRIAFVSKRSDAAGDLWLVPVRRTDKTIVPQAQPIRVTDYLGEDSTPCFSPDGTEIAFCSDRSGRREIWTVTLKSGAVRRVTTQGGLEPHWSPNGVWLAYTTWQPEAGRGAIAVTPAHPEAHPELPREVLITDGSTMDCQPSWSPDGQQLVFCRFPFDSNGDGRITPDDHAVIVRAPVSFPSSPEQPPSAPAGLQFWLTSGAHFDFAPCWQAGEVICFASDRSGNLDVWAVPSQGVVPRQASAPEQLAYAQTLFPLLPLGFGDPSSPSPEAMYERLLALRRVRDFFPAEQRYEAQALVEMARSYRALGQVASAERALHEVETQFCQEREACGLAAGERIDLGLATAQIDSRAAVAALQEMLVRYREQPLVRARVGLRLGALQLAIARPLEALGTYGHILTESRGDRQVAAESQLRIGDCFMALGSQEEAERAYVLVVQNFPEQEGQVEEAVRSLLREQDYGGDTTALVRRCRLVAAAYRARAPRVAAMAQLRAGELLVSAGQFESAQMELAPVAEQYADEPMVVARATLLLAEAYSRGGDWRKAVSLLEQTEAAFDTLAGGRWAAVARRQRYKALMQSAEQLLQARYFPLAAARYRQALLLVPGEAEAHRGYIQAQYYARNIRQTTREYEALAARTPDDPIALYGLGLCLSYRATEEAELHGRPGRIDPALLTRSNSVLDKALELDYRIVYAYLTKSYNYEMLETYDRFRRSQPQNLPRRLLEAVTAPLVSLLRMVTMTGEQGPTRNYERAIEALTLALGLNDEAQNPKLEERLCRNLANNYYQLAEFGFQKAYEYYHLALRYDSAFASRRDEAVIMERMGHCALVVEDFDRGPVYLQRAIALYRDLGRDDLVLLNIKRLAVLYQLAQDYLSAVEYFDQALAMEKQRRNAEEVQRLYRNLAYNYWLLGEPQDALAHAFRARDLLESGRLKKTKESSSRIQLGLLGWYAPIPFVDLSKMGALGGSAAFGFTTEEERALVYTILANVLVEEKRYEEAIAENEQKLALYRRRKDRRAEAAVLNNLGYLQVVKGDLAAAWKHFELSYRLCEREKVVAGVAVNAINLAQLALLMGDPLQCEAAATRVNGALSFVEGPSRVLAQRRAQLLNLLGSLTLEPHHRPPPAAGVEEQVRYTAEMFQRAEYAQTYFEEACRLSVERRLPREEAVSRMNQARSWSFLGEWDQAARALLQARRICQLKGYSDLLWQVNQGLAELVFRLDENTRRRLRLAAPRSYFEEALAELRAVSEASISRGVLPLERARHRQLYEDYAFFLAAVGDTIGALQISEQLRSHAFLTAVSGEALRLSSPTRTNLLNWVRTFREELTTTELQLRRLGAVLPRNNPRLIRLRAVQDSLSREYNAALAQLRAEAPELESLVTIQVPPVSTFQRALDTSEVALSYLVAPQATLVWAISSKHVVMFRLELGAEEAREAVRRFTSGAAQGQSQAADLFLLPAASLLRQASRVIVVPDGPLSGLPMQAAFLRSLGPHAPPVTVCSSMGTYLLALNRRSVGGPVVLLGDATLQQPLQALGYEVALLPPAGKSTAPPGKDVAHALLGSNIVHLQTRWRGQENAPLHSTLQLAGTQEGTALPLADLLELGSTATVCVLELVDSTRWDFSLSLLDRLFALSGTSAVLLVHSGAGIPTRLDLLHAFYRQLLEVPPAEAFRAALLSVRQEDTTAVYAQLLGFGGMSKVEAATYAGRALAGKVRMGLQAEQGKDWIEAVRYYEEAMTMAASLKDTTTMERLRLLIVRASANGGLLRKTIQYQTLLVQEAEAKGDVPLTIRRARSLASLHAEAGDLAPAIESLAKVIALAKDHQPQLLAELFREQGILYERSGNYRAALAQYEASRRRQEEAGNQVGVAASLTDMGRVTLRHLEDAPQAVSYLQTAVALLQDREPTPALVDAQHNLGLAYEVLADYQTALEIQHQARAEAEKLGLADKVALSEHYLANLFWKTGDYHQALRYNERALQGFQKQGDRALEALALATRGLVYLSIGNGPQALRDQHAALEIVLRTGDLMDEATIRLNIGLVHLLLGEHDAALEEFSTAARLDSTLGSLRGLSYALRNMGSVLQQKGSLQEAEGKLQRALELSRRTGDRRNEAQCLYFLGAVRRGLHDRDQAARFLQEAADWARALFVPEVEWRALHELGLLDREARQLEQSRTHLLQALQVIEQMRARIRVAEYQAGFINDKQEVYADLIDLLVAMGRDEEALTVAERARARGFLDLLSNRQLHLGERTGTDAYESLSNLQTQLRTVQEEVARLRGMEQEAVSAAQRRRLEELAAQLGALRGRYEAQLVKLKESDPRLADMVSIDPWPVARLQALLPPDAAVVAYFAAKERLYLWLLTRSAVKAWAVPVGREALATQVGELRRAIAELMPVAQQSTRLWQTLLGPLASSLQGITTLIFVPHGPLHYLPFSCLTSPEGQYLVERFAVATAPSNTVLGMCMEEGGRFLSVPRRQLRVLALGNPSLAGQARPLPMAAKEAESASRSFPNVHSFLGTAARETVVKQAGNLFDLYLFSCHGEYDAVNPLFSCLLLSADKQNDGRLEAHEIFALRMDSYLVAMSACETALSALAGGDEIIGLTRSFIFAGATSLFASLWKVDDLATAIVVKRFLRHIAEGESRARALQKAQLLVMKEVYAHPAYWAAFQITGDFR